MRSNMLVIFQLSAVLAFLRFAFFSSTVLRLFIHQGTHILKIFLILIYLFLAAVGSLLQYMSFSLVARVDARVHGLSSCDTGALLPSGMWGLPQPGLKSAISALEDRFLTIGPPGKSQGTHLKISFIWHSRVKWKRLRLPLSLSS